jgi:DNA polymerase-3 subunit alpha
VRPQLTRQLVLNVNARQITEPFIQFIEKNLKAHKGRSSLKINVYHEMPNQKISLINMEGGFELNDELVQFLENNPEVEVQVVSI